MLIIVEPPAGVSYEPFVNGITAHLADNPKIKINEVDVRGDIYAFSDEISSYTPSTKNNVLILIGSHYREFALDSPEYRNTEYAVQKKGGLVWGGNAGHDSSITYSGDLDTDVEHVLSEAVYAEARARLFKKESVGLTARSYSDPHTILVGIGLTYPALSAQNRHVIGSFPTEWWEGVGFTRGTNQKQLENLIYWYDSTNFVAIGANAAQALDAAGYRSPKDEAAGVAPLVKDIYKKDSKNRYGILLRNLATHPENALDWTP